MANDRWELIVAVPRGHRYFREVATGEVAIADDSGEWPEDCDGGPLFVAVGEGLQQSADAIFWLTLDGGYAAVMAEEAAALIRHLGMRPAWLPAIAAALAGGGDGAAGSPRSGEVRP